MLRAACLLALGAGASAAVAHSEYCGDSIANNYNPTPTYGASLAPWTCTYTYSGCTDPSADNYASYATISTSTCTYTGCNDTFATNFVASATFNNGACTYDKIGCMDTDAANYHVAFTASCGWTPPSPPSPSPSPPPPTTRLATMSIFASIAWS